MTTVCSVLYRFIRAFSDLFGKFLVPMKLGKNCVNLGKNTQFWGKKIVRFLAKLGKFTFNIWIFLLIGNVSSQLGIFSANLEKNWNRKPVQFCIEKKPWVYPLYKSIMV